MKESNYSVHDIWNSDDSIVDMLSHRIEECGSYQLSNEEWQCLSTMIDYALKTKLAKKDKQVVRVIENLSEIGYVPLDRVSSSPPMKFGTISLSDNGTIGINEYSAATLDLSSNELYFHTSLDVLLTGTCCPIFSIILKGKTKPIYAISHDSNKVAVLNEDQATVWNLADCRILFKTTSIDNDSKRGLLWSGNNKKIVIVCNYGFRIIPIDGSEESGISASIDDINNILTNDDASEFYYCNGGTIYHATDEGIARVVGDRDMKIDTCYLLSDKDGYWALIDGSAYHIEDNKLSFVKAVDTMVNTDPHRFERIIADFMSQKLNEGNHYTKSTAIAIDGSNVIFKTILGSRYTVCCVVSSIDLSSSYDTADEEKREFILEDGDRIESIDGEYSFKVTRPEKGEQSRFFLIKGNEQIPLGTCRFDATARILNGKLFIHKGMTIEIYDLKGYKLLVSKMAIESEQWIICGNDNNGTISLVKIEDVQSTIGEGSFAKIRFGRMKVPHFTLDEFKDCFIEVNKVWNLKSSISVRNNILFYYNRDGNRVKPVTLSRYTLKSGNMKRSSTLKSDESKFGVKMCELSGERIAVVSFDDLDKNPSEDPRITIRIISCGKDRKSELCDISKCDESGHLNVSSISEVFVLKDEGHECIIVQFNSDRVPLICSRDVDSRRQYPEKDGYVKGTVVSHDDRTCIVRNIDGSYSRYDARLNCLEDVPDYVEDSTDVERPSLEIPLNKEFRTSFGRIMQNYGVFFCLKDSE